MSIAAIRAALETALASITPSLATAYENQAFTPPAADQPYQRVLLRPAKPVNDEVGDRYTEVGVLQVALYYPAEAGANGVDGRIGLLRQTFARGAAFTASGVVVTVSDVAETIPGLVEEGRWSVTVRIPYWAHVTP